MDLTNVTVGDYGGTIIITLLSLLFLVYAAGPWNWRFIKNRWAGVVIRFGRVNSELLGEGPVHIWWPFERLVRVPLFDLKVDIPLPNLTTAAPNPQNVDVKLQSVIRFADPIQVILSVPDRDPVQEFLGFVQAATRKGVQSMTVDELAGRDAGSDLAAKIVSALKRHPVLKRWGLDIVAIDVRDIDFSQAFRDAQDEVVRAEGEAKAIGIRAKARRDAADTVGQGDSKGLIATLFGEKLDAYVRMAQAGGLKTFIQAGDKLDELVAKWFKE